MPENGNGSGNAVCLRAWRNDFSLRGHEMPMEFPAYGVELALRGFLAMKNKRTIVGVDCIQKHLSSRLWFSFFGYGMFQEIASQGMQSIRIPTLRCLSLSVQFERIPERGENPDPFTGYHPFPGRFHTYPPILDPRAGWFH